MNVARSPCFSATDFTMNLKKRMFVRGGQRVIELEVHLELAIRVFVVVLIGAPAEAKHIVANLGNHVIAPHHGLLVIAGLVGDILWVGYFGAIGICQEKLGLDPGFHAQPFDKSLRRASRLRVTRGA